MNISNPLNRLWYWGARYHRRSSSHYELFLKDQALRHLEDESGQVQSPGSWHLGSWPVAVAIGITVVAFGVFFLTGVTSQWSEISTQTGRQLAEYTGILWQVQAGLLSVGFVVVVLLVQILGSRERLSGPVFEGYIRRSGIVTAAFLGLSAVGVMGATALFEAYELVSAGALAQVTAYNFLLLVATLIVIGYVYWKVVQFSRPGHVVELTAELLKRDLQRNFRQLILEDLASHILVARVPSWNFEYRSTPPRQTGVQEVDYPVGDRELRVVDVDMDALRRLATNVLMTEDRAGTVAWIRASIGTTLSSTRPEIGAFRPQTPDFVARRLSNYFVVDEDASERADWEASLEDLRTRTNQAIIERRPTELSGLLDVYEELLEEYARHVQQYDSGTIESITNDPLSKTRFFKPDEELFRDFTDLARRAIKEDDQALVQDVLHFPAKIMRLAQAQENVELFARFGRAYIWFYDAIDRLPTGPGARQAVVDSCWRRLKKAAERLSLRHFDVPENLNEITDKKPYALHILRMFNRLAKRALDLQDHESFRTFYDKFNLLFGDLPHTRSAIRSEKLEAELKADEDVSSENSDENRLLDDAEDAVETVLITKSLVRFGLAAWILDLYRRKEVGQNKMQELIRKPASHFKSLSDLHEAYMQAVDESENGLRWRIWDRERDDRADERRARFVTVEKWLRRFYVVRGLELISPGDERNSEIPPSSRLNAEVDKIRGVCEQILDNGHPLSGFKDLDARAESFVRIHESGLRQQKKREADQLIEADLDDEKVESFEEAFLEDWEEYSLDRLIGEFCSVERGSLEEEDASAPTLTNPRMSKEPFLEAAPERRAARMGTLSGRDLAETEREQFVYALKSNLPVEKTTEEQFAGNFESPIEGRDLAPDLLLIGHQLLPSDLFSDGEFVPEWKDNRSESDPPGYVGRLGEIPVYRVPSTTKIVVAVDTSSISVRRLYHGQGDQPQIEVEKITKQRARELLEENPSLQREDESGPEAMHRLRQQVVVERASRLYFEIGDDAGVAIVIEDDEDEEDNG
jgi:hypothetical protein